MASYFLRKKAEEQAEKLEKEFGASAYCGTTWLDEQINGGTKWTDLQKKDTAKEIAPMMPNYKVGNKDKGSDDAAPKNIRSYFEKNGVMESYDSLYDAHALEVIGIEGVKKESDASGKVYEQGSEARATSDLKLSIADLLNLVKGDATKYIPEKQYCRSCGFGYDQALLACSGADQASSRSKT